MEEIPFALRDYVFFVVRKVAVFLAITLGSIYVFDTYFESPSDRTQRRELAFLEMQLERMEGEFDNLQVVLEDISGRDDAIYRSIFGVDKYPEHLRNPGVGGFDRGRALRGYSHSEAVISAEARLAELQRKMVAQSRSFDEVFDLAKNQTELLKSIPAIQPVRNEDLKRMASGYGYRIHPIYKVRKMHYGMDFSAPRGTPVYATGNGKIEKVKRSRRGYGNQVKINHGFGYKTFYAHLEKYTVRKGQKVKRGDLIGYVGTSGISTAPHLHYEVIKGNRKLNPVYFYFSDLTPEEYDRMLEMASQENQSLD